MSGTSQQSRLRAEFDKLFRCEPEMTFGEFVSSPDALEYASRRGESLSIIWFELVRACGGDMTIIRGRLRYCLTRIQAAQLEQALRF